jgi:acyl carrier protein
MNTLSNLQVIFRDVFDDETITLTRCTSAEDIEDWDSLMHINIIVACENEFGIKFDLADIVELENVGGMVDVIEKKLR